MPFRRYSADIKVVAVDWRLRRIPLSIIRRRLHKRISQRSLIRWTQLYRRTQAVIRDPHEYKSRGKPLLLNQADRDFMEALVEEHPSLFLDEIRERLYNEQGKMPSISTVQLELQKRLQITLKKACVSSVRKDLVAKYKWMDRMMGFPANFLVFTDESAVCARDLLRFRQRAKIGLRTTRKVPRIHSGRYSLIPAIGYHDLIGLSVLEGTVNRKRFESFLKYKVLPRMNRYPGPNSVLVLDNASIHHGGRIASLCEKKGVLLRYLPAYCPELNPIELGFNVFKADCRRCQVLATTSNPVKAITKIASRTFVGDLLRPLYHHCGYSE